MTTMETATDSKKRIRLPAHARSKLDESKRSRAGCTAKTWRGGHAKVTTGSPTDPANCDVVTKHVELLDADGNVSVPSLMDVAIQRLLHRRCCDAADNTRCMCDRVAQPRVALHVPPLCCVGPIHLGIEMRRAQMSLFEYMCDARYRCVMMRVQQLPALFEHVGRALARLHAAGIAHLDLKPANIVVDVDDATGCIQAARLIDFGSSQVCDRGFKHPRLCTYVFAPPEMFRAGQDPDGNRVTDLRATDAYSLGVCMLAFVNNYVPLEKSEHAMKLPEFVRLHVKTCEADAEVRRAALRASATVATCLFVDDATRARADAVLRNVDRLLAPRGAARAAVVQLFPDAAAEVRHPRPTASQEVQAIVASAELHARLYASACAAGLEGGRDALNHVCRVVADAVVHSEVLQLKGAEQRAAFLELVRAIDFDVLRSIDDDDHINATAPITP